MHDQWINYLSHWSFSNMRIWLFSLWFYCKLNLWSLDCWSKAFLTIFDVFERKLPRTIHWLIKRIIFHIHHNKYEHNALRIVQHSLMDLEHSTNSSETFILNPTLGGSTTKPWLGLKCDQICLCNTDVAKEEKGGDSYTNTCITWVFSEFTVDRKRGGGEFRGRLWRLSFICSVFSTVQQKDT